MSERRDDDNSVSIDGVCFLLLLLFFAQCSTCESQQGSERQLRRIADALEAQR